MDGLIGKVDSNGNLSWMELIGSGALKTTRILGLAIDASGVYATVYTNGTLGGAGVVMDGTAGTSSSCLLKLDTSGVQQWVICYGAGAGTTTTSSVVLNYADPVFIQTALHYLRVFCIDDER